MSAESGLLVAGKIRYGNEERLGRLLLTDRSVYVLLENVSDWRCLPWIGSIIAVFAENHSIQTGKQIPLKDPELKHLKESVKLELAQMIFVTKLPISDDLSIKQTRRGLRFQTDREQVIYLGDTRALTDYFGSLKKAVLGIHAR